MIVENCCLSLFLVKCQFPFTFIPSFFKEIFLLCIKLGGIIAEEIFHIRFLASMVHKVAAGIWLLLQSITGIGSNCYNIIISLIMLCCFPLKTLQNCVKLCFLHIIYKLNFFFNITPSADFAQLNEVIFFQEGMDTLIWGENKRIYLRKIG